MTLGIIGGGQLGRMLALAAARLGVRCRVLDRPGSCAADVAELVPGSLDEGASLPGAFLEGLDAATFEFENVPAGLLRAVAARVPTWPPPAALKIAQDRASEKALAQRVGIPTPRHASPQGPEGLRAAIDTVGLPAIVKPRRLGYDGKGQIVARDARDAQRAVAALGPTPAIVEALVPFDAELSQVAARDASGNVVFYPPTQNVHADGILRRSIAPAPCAGPALTELARRHTAGVLDALDYVGVLAIEYFVVGDRLLFNEMAPRVHNSGHWTIDAAVTSQFENHVRAVLGLPLGDASMSSPHAAMVNLIGRSPPLPSLLAVAGARVHLYGKEERPGRKIGHVTLAAGDAGSLMDRVAEVESLVRDADARAVPQRQGERI